MPGSVTLATAPSVEAPVVVPVAATRWASRGNVAVEAGTGIRRRQRRHTLQDAPELQEARQEALGLVYGFMDGQAAQRAAEAITEAIDRYSRGQRINTNNRKRRKTVKISQFQKKQVALRARVRLRNFKRGHTLKSGQIEQGIDARRGRVFFTDEAHAEELVRNNQATYEPGIKWPEDATQEVPQENLTQDDAPDIDLVPVGGGYYEVVEDGHVQGKYRGKRAAQAIARQISEIWAQENLSEAELKATEPRPAKQPAEKSED